MDGTVVQVLALLSDFWSVEMEAFGRCLKEMKEKTPKAMRMMLAAMHPEAPALRRSVLDIFTLKGMVKGSYALVGKS